MVFIYELKNTFIFYLAYTIFYIAWIMIVLVLIYTQFVTKSTVVKIIANVRDIVCKGPAGCVVIFQMARRHFKAAFL